MNLISICNMIFMLCNVNAKFAPISYKKALIPHLLLFYGIRTKIKQIDGRNQVKRKLLICSRLLVAAKRNEVHQGEEKASLL